jgi:thymidylate synthase (FAD)
MRRVEPKVFVIGGSCINHIELNRYLEHVGAPEWDTDAVSDAEELSEFYGRLCYRSFRVGMNANVTKIREGNDVYLANILKVKHGSVLEHAVTHWVFADVSRVFTHELVRHRAGTAFSQESLRFVRLTDLGLWLPPEADNDPQLRDIFEKTFESAETLQKALANILGLDDEGKQFKDKKILTSLMRRLAPDGLATTIGATFNFRALRHIIEMRTAESAEAEIRFVFDKVAETATKRWPNIFADFSKNEKGEWVPKNSKV